MKVIKKTEYPIPGDLARLLDGLILHELIFELAMEEAEGCRTALKATRLVRRDMAKARGILEELYPVMAGRNVVHTYGSATVFLESIVEVEDDHTGSESKADESGNIPDTNAEETPPRVDEMLKTVLESAEETEDIPVMNKEAEQEASSGIGSAESQDIACSDPKVKSDTDRKRLILGPDLVKDFMEVRRLKLRFSRYMGLPFCYPVLKKIAAEYYPIHLNAWLKVDRAYPEYAGRVKNWSSFSPAEITVEPAEYAIPATGRDMGPRAVIKAE